jgi:hypothetical protein
MLHQVLKLFKNITTLKLSCPYITEEIFKQVNLPQLQTLEVDHMRYLNFLTGLRNLRRIYIRNLSEDCNCGEAFDPS